MSIVTPLVPIVVPSIYADGALPKRMALCTPDTARALAALCADLRGLGHELRVSDLFRSYDVQAKAHADWAEKRKRAWSPPPGTSMHEAGRAIDVDLSSTGVSLARFWDVARAHGFLPVADAPVASRSEAWHFDCRGSHDAVYEYVRAGRAGASVSPYAQMAASAILAIGEGVDPLADREVGVLQAALIRLGFDPGRIDGVLGERTRAALDAAGVAGDDAAALLADRLRERFPGEF